MSVSSKIKIAEKRKHQGARKIDGNPFLWTCLYNFCFGCFSLGYFPFFLKRLKQAEDPKRLVRERWGKISPDVLARLEDREVLWIHAVSVGEAISIEKIAKRLEAEVSNAHILITTVTPTGQAIAKKWEGPNITVCYFPFDFSFAVARFMKAIKPKAVFLAETEIWPNFLTIASQEGVPVSVLNARLSARSKQRYVFFQWIFKRLFSRLEFVLAQTDDDAARFKELGVEDRQVKVAGNLKFDNVDLDAFATPDADLLRRQWQLKQNDFVIIAGSTHPNEDEIILEAFETLKSENSEQKLIIAPRHVDRVDHITKIVNARSFSYQRTSQFDPKKEWRVLVVDQMGILKDLYSIADLVVMGGSFVPHGGQNPIEPGSFKKAVIHGPHVFNFKKVYQALNESGGSIRVERSSDLGPVLKRLYHNQSERNALGEASYNLIRREQGATQRHIDEVLTFLMGERN